MVSGGFQCVSHVAPSTTRDDGSIAPTCLERLRHDLDQKPQPQSSLANRPLPSDTLTNALSTNERPA